MRKPGHLSDIAPEERKFNEMKFYSQAFLVTLNMSGLKTAKDDKDSPPSEGCPQDGVGIVTFINSIPIYRCFTQNLPVNKSLRGRARSLRKAYNLSEVSFWKEVHKGKFHQLDFDRQRIIGNYIVDFYIKSLSLIIEIDGASHNCKEAYDTKREKYLEALGLKIFRISTQAMKFDLTGEMLKLENYIIKNYSGN